MSYSKGSAVRGGFVFHQSWPFTRPRMPSLPQRGYFQPSHGWKGVDRQVQLQWQMATARSSSSPAMGGGAWGAWHAGHSCKPPQDHTPTDKRCIPITQLPPRLLLGFNAAVILERSEQFKQFKMKRENFSLSRALQATGHGDNVRAVTETAVHHVTAVAVHVSAVVSELTHTLAARHSQIEAVVFDGRGARQSQGPVVWRGEGLGKWERTAFTKKCQGASRAHSPVPEKTFL